MNNIAILASGSGTNAENIINYFENCPQTKVSLIVSNKKNAFVLERAKNHGIESVVMEKTEFFEKGNLLHLLTKHHINFVVLAGFLLLVPEEIVEQYRGRILNIHPALLPKFGGKGMYGDNVHKAVIEAGEKESGITIHQVNEKFDSGDIVFQATVAVTSDDTPDTLAQKIHELEYRHFPEVIAQTIQNSK